MPAPNSPLKDPDASVTAITLPPVAADLINGVMR